MDIETTGNPDPSPLRVGDLRPEHLGCAMSVLGWRVDWLEGIAFYLSEDGERRVILSGDRGGFSDQQDFPAGAPIEYQHP